MTVSVIAFALKVRTDAPANVLDEARDHFAYLIECDPRYAGHLEILQSEAKPVPDLEWLAEPPIFRAARAAWFSGQS